MVCSWHVILSVTLSTTRVIKFFCFPSSLQLSIFIAFSLSVRLCSFVSQGGAEALKNHQHRAAAFISWKRGYEQQVQILLGIKLGSK